MKLRIFLFTVLLIAVFSGCNNPVDPDKTAPQINLSLTHDSLYVGQSWEGVTYLALDDADGDLTNQVTASGQVDSSSPGTYIISYSVSDKAGNSQSSACTVVVDIAPGLFAHYDFNGSADDRSGNSYDLNVFGATLTEDRNGRVKSAYNFDGTGYMVRDSVSFPLGKSAKTITGWFRSSDRSVYQALFGLGIAREQKNFQTAMGPDGTDMVMRVNGWSLDWLTSLSAQDYFDNTWHHCAVTYDGTVTSIYMDGEKMEETSGYSYISDSSFMRIAVGIEIDLDGWNFRGDLDDVRIYSCALTDLQIKALYKLDEK